MSNITKWSSYETIAELDPIEFDSRASSMVAASQEGSVKILREIFYESVDLADSSLAQGIDTDNAVAALRDLDFMVGSLLRIGQHEQVQAPVATSVLTELGRVAGTVPRGTVYTYAACNPANGRERSFTGTDEEAIFIGAVRQSVFALDKTVGYLATSHESDAIAMAHKSLKVIIPEMIAVKKAVSPLFFSERMRPFFDELHIGDASYAGAGGAQMQVVTVDRMVWGSDCDDLQYQAYYADNARYLTPAQLAVMQDTACKFDGKSLVTLAEEGELDGAAVTELSELLKTLRKFRYPHRKVAEENFALRPGDAVGSGQYTPSVLTKLLELNTRAIVRLTS